MSVLGPVTPAPAAQSGAPAAPTGAPSAAETAGQAPIGPPPALPDNWYALAESRALRPGRSLAREIGAQEVVLMRAPDGQLAAFAAHCAHMGCHLRHGSVEAGGLRCALHRRLIAADGAFLGQDGRPVAGLVQRSHPVTERYGLIYVWIGTTAPQPLPLPVMAKGEAWVARPAGTFETGTDWGSLVANGFDMEHLATVHRRRLIEDATVTRPTADSFRLTYRSRVTGGRLSDRLIRHLSGNEVHASMTSWRGSMMFVQSRIGARHSFFILSMCPRPCGGTLVRSAVGLIRPRAALAEGARLWATARLFKTFLADDFQVLTGLRWHPPAQVHGTPDRDSQLLARFFAALPGAAP